MRRDPCLRGSHENASLALAGNSSVFSRTPSTRSSWDSVLDIDGEAADDVSGWSVSLSSDGSVVAIGAIGNDGNGSNSGHVRVYAWDGSSWVQRGADIDGEAAGDGSGAVSLSSDGFVVAIGAPDNADRFEELETAVHVPRDGSRARDALDAFCEHVNGHLEFADSGF